MLKKLLPREERFFEYFTRQSTVIAEGLALFKELIENYSRRPELTRKIKEVENRADGVAHEIFQLLNNTFVTPFDREDIQMLVNRMDDIMDFVEKAGSRMEIYEIAEVPEAMAAMFNVVHKAFLKLTQAIGMLDNFKNRESISKICIEVNSLENEGDTILRHALHRLFKDYPNPLDVIKHKEIYENLEEAIDRCEDLANIIETILLKNA